MIKHIHQLGLPISLENIIPEDDSVRLLYDVTEGLNYTELYETYSTIGRNPAILPETLFRIIVYGYMEWLYSSRDLAKACKRDINFKWLLQGQKAPSYVTIARFRSNHLVNCMENLFNQLILALKQQGDVNFKNIFIDGTKIEANANRYTFVWKKSIEKFEEKLQSSISKCINEITVSHELDIKVPEGKITVTYVKELLNKLVEIKKNKDIEFVYGKGKRKSLLQKNIECINNFIEKQSTYDEYIEIFDGRNSFSKTDKDATFMRMKEDHMRNGQLKPGYNIQIGVEAEYIVGVDVSSERSDQLTFIPFLEKLECNLKDRYESVTADAGYESAENYVYLDKNKQDTYIKPQTYEKSKTKKYKQDISKKENMSYDEKNDYYICAAGKKISVVGTKTRKSKSGFKSIITIYECEDCSNCSLKEKCTKAKGNKQIHVDKNFIKQRKKSLENITSSKGKILRMNRSIQVEGAFGVIKQDYGFRKFLMRGKHKVIVELLLLAFGYNINKLHRKTRDNRRDHELHKMKSA